MNSKQTSHIVIVVTIIVLNLLLLGVFLTSVLASNETEVEPSVNVTVTGVDSTVLVEVPQPTPFPSTPSNSFSQSNFRHPFVVEGTLTDDAAETTAAITESESTADVTTAETTVEITEEIAPETTVPETSATTTVKPAVTEAPVHVHNYTSTVCNATCTEDGYIRHVCECGEWYEEKIDAIGHNYSVVSTTPSNYIIHGQIVMVCTHCGDTKYEELPLLSSVADTDLCGESLIGKALAHADNSDMMLTLLSGYSANPADKAVLCTVPTDDMNNNVMVNLNTSYRYLRTVIQPARSTNRMMFSYLGEQDEQQQAAYEYAQSIIESLGIANTTTQKDALLLIHEWVVSHKEYDYDAAAGRTPTDATVYYSLFADKGVCHNYSLAMQVLCLTAGIECHYYVSDAMNHAWNEVFFSDGSHLWIDATWDDCRSSMEFFMMSDEQLALSHTL